MTAGAPPLHLRRYVASDTDAVWALHNSALEALGVHGGNGPWDADLHAIEPVYIQPGGEFLVGEVTGTVVAMGALLLHDLPEAEIKRMRIHPEHQRRGYGRSMLSALEAAALQRGCTRVRLDTSTVQTAAQAMYRAAGYREERRSRWGPFTLVHYAKDLVTSA